MKELVRGGAKGQPEMKCCVLLPRRSGSMRRRVSEDRQDVPPHPPDPHPSCQSRVGLAADAHLAYGYHGRSERHCCQLAEEPLGDVATTAEEA